jgi:7SK snRNA methylphosphate capping enzyme
VEAGTKGGGYAKDGRIFSHGNYDTYYGYRGNANADVDPRIQALLERDENFFKDKAVLDIGCNIGYTTFCVAKQGQARYTLGVDIDASLIKKALDTLRERKDLGDPLADAESGQGDSQASTLPPTANPRQEEVGGEGQDAAVDQGYLWSMEFRSGEFVHSDLEERRKQKYGVVLCLSVLKWIHFHQGDDGVRQLFDKIFNLLEPGGIFVMEPQSWKSYQKKKDLTPHIKATVASIKLKPALFPEVLERDYGFEKLDTLSPPKATEGFDRPLMLFRKPIGPNPLIGRDLEPEEFLPSKTENRVKGPTARCLDRRPGRRPLAEERVG